MESKDPPPYVKKSQFTATGRSNSARIRDGEISKINILHHHPVASGVWVLLWPTPFLLTYSGFCRRVFSKHYPLQPLLRYKCCLYSRRWIEERLLLSHLFCHVFPVFWMRAGVKMAKTSSFCKTCYKPSCWCILIWENMRHPLRTFFMKGLHALSGYDKKNSMDLARLYKAFCFTSGRSSQKTTQTLKERL